MSTARIKNYQDAKEFLGGKSNRPFAHNTRIKLDDMGHDRIIVTYHDNPIVSLMPDYVSFNTCGWRTSTTKERLNWFMPDGWRVYQERGNWIVSNYHTGQQYNFADGITYSGNVWHNYAPESLQQEIKARTKQIKKYVSGYVLELLKGNISKPSAGDCFYCVMREVTTNKPLGDITNNTDHLESHFDESYYVPSLLINAIESFPICLMSREGIARIWDGESINDWQKDIIKRDITSSLTRYLKRQFGIAA